MLHLATHFSDENVALAMVDIFLRHGADICAENHHGIIPLHMAAGTGHATLSRRLMAATESLPGLPAYAICRYKGFDGTSSVDRARESGHVNVVRMMIEECGVDIDCRVRL